MPRQIRNILCPVNLRHAAHDTGGYETALQLARLHGASVVVATVVPEMERNLNIRDSEGFWGAKLKDFLAEHPAGDVAVRAVVLKGAPHRQIVKFADRERIDLIVMEAANPRIQDYLLGTTASHVVTHADCAVYVVR